LDEIYCCAFDKNRVFTGGVDAHIFLWDIRTGRYVQKLDYHTVCFIISVLLLLDYILIINIHISQ